MTLTPNNTKTPKKTRRKPSGRKKGVVLQDFKWAGQYKDFLQQKLVPVSKAMIERVAQDYAEWALNDDEAFKASQFYLKKGIPPDTFYDWVKQHECMSLANKIALQAMGNRREMGGLQKKLDSSIVQFTMPAYDKQWKELQEWRSRLKEKEAPNETKVVVLERYAPIEEAPNENRPTPEEVAYKARSTMHGNDTPRHQRNPYKRKPNA